MAPIERYQLSITLRVSHGHAKQCTSVPTHAIQASSTIALHLVQECLTPQMFAPQQAQRTTTNPNDAKVGVATSCVHAGRATTMEASYLKVKEWETRVASFLATWATWVCLRCRKDPPASEWR